MECVFIPNKMSIGGLAEWLKQKMSIGYLHFPLSYSHKGKGGEKSKGVRKETEKDKNKNALLN
jgi:hypothetical protein